MHFSWLGALRVGIYLYSIWIAIGYVQIAQATSEQQAVQQQRFLQQQQEQQRQFHEQQRNLKAIHNIRGSRIADRAMEDGQVDIQPIAVQNKCDLAYNQCINACRSEELQVTPSVARQTSYDSQLQQQTPQLTAKTLACLQQCVQIRTDCLAELEATCPYRFNQIILKGNEIYSTQTLNKKIVQHFLNKCINKSNITALQSQLTNLYIRNGYSMARVYFDTRHIIREQVANPETGKLEAKTTFILIIEEGKVSHIKLDIQSEQKPTAKEQELAQLFHHYQQLKAQETTAATTQELQKLKPQLAQLALQVKQENLQRKQQPAQLSKWSQFRHALQPAFAFPFREGRVFKIRDFEQGLDQMNRLQSNNVTMKVEPATEAGLLNDGYANIILINNQDPTKNGVSTGKRTTFLNVGIGNSGSESTGENMFNFSISKDNLFSINDNFYFNYTENSDSLLLFNGNRVQDSNDPATRHPFRNALDLFGNDHRKQKYNKSLYSSLSFPIGYWTITTSLNYSTYKTINAGHNTTFHTTGQTVTQSYSLDRVMYRTAKYKLNVGTTLEIRDTESYIRDFKSDTGSKQTSSGSIYFNNTIFTKRGTIIIKPSYQKGLAWFAAKMDEGVYGSWDFDKREPRLQHDLLKLYLYYNAKFNLPLLTTTQIQDTDLQSAVETNATANQPKDVVAAENKTPEPVVHKLRNRLPISYSLTFDSQYSFHALYAKDQFSAGGEYTVRGFRETSISGDHGFYLRNDVKINLLQLLPKFLTEAKTSQGSPEMAAAKHSNSGFAAGPLNAFLAQTYVSLFYDYGYVSNKYNDELQMRYNARSGHLSGFGVGLNYYGKRLNWSLTYAKALHSPSYLETRDGLEREDYSIYWKLGLSW